MGLRRRAQCGTKRDWSPGASIKTHMRACENRDPGWKRRKRERKISIRGWVNRNEKEKHFWRWEKKESFSRVEEGECNKSGTHCCLHVNVTCVCVCVCMEREIDRREKKEASGWCRKRSNTFSPSKKGTKLISEALTNYFLRKGVGYLQLSLDPSPHPSG